MPPLLRVAFGLLTFIAIVWQLTIHIQNGYNVLNFFSYFTNLANLYAAAVLLLAASRIHATQLPLFDTLRAVAVVNMALVGLVFGALLRNVDLGSLLPWINVVLHYVMPCVIVADWLLQPPKARLRANTFLFVLLIPSIYLLYVLVRGGVVGWYPYPFLNPANVGGYAGVAAYAVAIATGFLIVGWMLIALGNKRSQRIDGTLSVRN